MPKHWEEEENDSNFTRTLKRFSNQVADGLAWYKESVQTSFATQLATIVTFFVLLTVLVVMFILSAYSGGGDLPVMTGDIIPAPLQPPSSSSRPVNKLTDPATMLAANQPFTMPRVAVNPVSLSVKVFGVALLVAVLVTIGLVLMHDNESESLLNDAATSPYYYVSWVAVLAVLSGLAYFGAQTHHRHQSKQHLQAQIAEIEDGSEELARALQFIKDKVDLAHFEDMFGDDFAGAYEVSQSPLSRGNYGAVYKGFERSTGRVVAVKRIPLFMESNSKGSQVTDDMIRRTVDEVVLMSMLARHRNVIQLHRAFLIGSEIWLVMDFMDGLEVSKLIETRGAFPEPVTAYILKQVLAGLAHLHSSLVIHRDIKPSNWMFTSDGTVKLIDLGVAYKLRHAGDTVKENIGTWTFLSPEMVYGIPYSLYVDIWAVGISALYMHRGRCPRDDVPKAQLLKLIAKKPVPPMDDEMSAELRDFVRQCLIVDPLKRATAKQLLQHPFLKLACDQATFVSFYNGNK